ncbi:H+/Cl- antiporter ClcA [Dokdonella fugitiva]|uniref:H+/Cl- antiporter ClcA n=1 Tax=Dokdonella fugitiva TaxID=328517 RepID=A0A839EYZ4_9GAMM|nr:chloride channel protein [Dokdonella fugitiva]MBA8887873.1 H+/Cl- antiporter ClcA [Dokdonella fugitiva]
MASRIDRLKNHDWLSPHQWRRRTLLWGGAVLVGLSAILFARASEVVYGLFLRLLEHSRYWPLLLTPAVFALLSWSTSGVFKATRGSGIPQAIAALQVDDPGFRGRLLSLRVAAGKMALTLAALAAGASIGREGPTVHVGAGLMYALGRRFGFADPQAAARFVLAGGAAGIAAAFNAPLAGVVFAIEEMAGAFESRMSGVVLTAVIIAGVVSLGIVGEYAYFGKITTAFPLSRSWLAILPCALACGLAGGTFARVILLDSGRVLARVARLRERWPVRFAAACGFVLALLGLASAGSVYGTGYDQARAILEGAAPAPSGAFGALKFLANIVSYWASIPGGIFSPALAVGAGIGQNIAAIMPGAESSAVVLLGMAGYLAAVTQAPLTSAIISMELTDNRDMVIPILAVCMLARAVSSLVCRTPVYKAIAQRLIRDFEQERMKGAAA